VPEITYHVSWDGAGERTDVAVLSAGAPGEPSRVRIGDAELELTMARAADGVLLVRTAAGASYRVFARRTDAGFELGLEGRTYRLHVASERDAWRGAAGGHAHASGSASVSMPGRVVKILAAEGQAVEAGQPLIIIEAMKMENEVKAGVAGIVERVLVSEGQSVEAGQVLVEVGAAEDSR
jgi:acetyl/propionyl-CoA carboxylase alpha subunit